MRDDSAIQSDEDVRLMLKVKTGDRQAYTQLYQKYVPVVRRYLARRDMHAQSCDDLTQEVFTRIWHARARYRPLSPLKYYLLGVAANVQRESRSRVGNHLALDTRHLECLPDAKRASPPSRVQSAEQIQAIRTLMTKLATRQRQAVELVYLAGLPPDEAARRLGCSLKTIHTHLYQARRKLRGLAHLSE